jgi:hypothetical protein
VRVLAERQAVVGIVVARIGELVDMGCNHDTGPRNRREALSGQRAGIVNAATMLSRKRASSSSTPSPFLGQDVQDAQGDYSQIQIRFILLIGYKKRGHDGLC